MKRYTSKNETGADILELKPDCPTWVVSQGNDLGYKISGDAIEEFAKYEDLAERGILFVGQGLALLEEMVEELENCYGRETELTQKARDFINSN